MTSHPAASVKGTTSSIHPSIDVGRSKTPEPLAVFNLTIPRSTRYNLSNTSNPPTTVTSSHQSSVTALRASTSISTTSKATPTHTVAPLRVAANHNMPMIRQEAGPLYSVVSVATAPVATYQVSPTVSTSKSHLTPKPALSVTGERVLTSATAISQHARVSTAPPGNSGSSVTGIPVTVALSIQQPHILNRSAVHVTQPSMPFVQPQIAYIPHGKDLIPVVLPPSAIQQLQYPAYPPLAMHSAQSSDKPSVVLDATGTSSSAHLNQTYMSALSKQLSTVTPNFPTALPFPMQQTQIRGLYPLPSPLYGSPTQLNMLQQQQLILDAYLHHQQR